MLPSLLGDEELDPAHDTVTGHTLRIGLYIKQVLVSLKLLELSQSAGATENTKYAPVISLQMDGIFAEQTSHNENWVNLQAGVDNIILSSNGPCPCGHKSLDSPAASSEILVRNAQPSNHGNAQQQYYNERFERTKWRQAKAKVKRLKPDLKDKHSQMVHNFHHQSSITHDNSANPPPNTVEHSTDERKGNNDLQDGSEGVKPNNDLTDGSAGVKPDEQARIGVTDTAGEHATKPDPQHDQSSDQQVDPFLDGSLFSPHPKFVPLSKPFWTDHINSLDEAAMLNRSGALYLDVVRSLEIVSVQEEHEEEEGLLEEKNDIGIVQEKMLLRTVLAPLLIKLNTSLVHRISYILRLLTDTMQAVRPFASTGEEKKGVTLTEDTMSLYCAGLIPFNVIQVAIFRPIIELYPLGEHPTPPPTTNKPNDTKDVTDSYSGATKDSSYGSKNDPVDYGPKLVIGWDSADIRITFPMHRELVRLFLDRTRNWTNESLMRDLCRKVTVDIVGVSVSTCFTGETANESRIDELISIPNLNTNVTLNQFMDNELKELMCLFKTMNISDLVPVTTPSSAQSTSTRLLSESKLTQLNLSLDSIDVQFNLYTYHIALCVLSSLNHMKPLWKRALKCNLPVDCDIITISVRLHSLTVHSLLSPLFICHNLTVSKLTGHIRKRDRCNDEFTYDNCILQSSQATNNDEPSSSGSSSDPSASSSGQQPTLSVLLQIPKVQPSPQHHQQQVAPLMKEDTTNNGVKTVVDDPNSSQGFQTVPQNEKDIAQNEVKSFQKKDIPPILVVKLRQLSLLGDVYLYKMASCWPSTSSSSASLGVCTMEGKGEVCGDLGGEGGGNTRTSSGLGQSHPHTGDSGGAGGGIVGRGSGGGGDLTSNSSGGGLFATPPASLDPSPRLGHGPARGKERDSVFSSETGEGGQGSARSNYRSAANAVPAAHHMTGVGDVSDTSTKSQFLRYYPVWKCLILSIQMDTISVYFPIKPLRNTSHASFDKLDTNLIVLKIPSISLSSLNRNISVNQMPTMISDPTLWSSDKLNFPWSLKLTNVISYTTIMTPNSDQSKTRMELYLLKPLDVTCTMALNVKHNEDETNECKQASSIPSTLFSSLQSLSFNIHINTSRVDINICQPQVDLLSQLLHQFVLELLASNLVSSECATRTATTTDTPQCDVTVSVLVQWTLARIIINLRTVTSHKHEQCKKIALELEDLIISGDYQPPSYQMVKFKMANASMHHFKRMNYEDPWVLGDYRGVIMKVNELNESRSSLGGGGGVNGRSSGEHQDTGGGLLSVTLTRANSDNLHSKIGTRDKVQKFNKYMSIPSSHTSHITEIIVKVSPLDFILAPSTLATFTEILSPLIVVQKKTPPPEKTSEKNSSQETSRTSENINSSLTKSSEKILSSQRTQSSQHSTKQLLTSTSSMYIGASSSINRQESTNLNEEVYSGDDMVEQEINKTNDSMFASRRDLSSRGRNVQTDNASDAPLHVSEQTVCLSPHKGEYDERHVALQSRGRSRYTSSTSGAVDLKTPLSPVKDSPSVVDRGESGFENSPLEMPPDEDYSRLETSGGNDNRVDRARRLLANIGRGTQRQCQSAGEGIPSEDLSGLGKNSEPDFRQTSNVGDQRGRRTQLVYPNQGGLSKYSGDQSSDTAIVDTITSDPPLADTLSGETFPIEGLTGRKATSPLPSLPYVEGGTQQLSRKDSKKSRKSSTCSSSKRDLSLEGLAVHRKPSQTSSVTSETQGSRKVSRNSSSTTTVSEVQQHLDRGDSQYSIVDKVPPSGDQVSKQSPPPGGQNVQHSTFTDTKPRPSFSGDNKHPQLDLSLQKQQSSEQSDFPRTAPQADLPLTYAPQADLPLKYAPHGHSSETALSKHLSEKDILTRGGDKGQCRPVTAPCDTFPSGSTSPFYPERPVAASEVEVIRESPYTSSKNLGNDFFQQGTKSDEVVREFPYTSSNNLGNDFLIQSEFSTQHLSKQSTSQLSLEDQLHRSHPSGTFKHSNLTSESGFNVRNDTGTFKNSAAPLSDFPTSRCHSSPYISSKNLEQGLETIPLRPHSSTLPGMRRDPPASRSALEGTTHYSNQKDLRTEARKLTFPSKNDTITESSFDNSKTLDQYHTGSEQHIQYSKGHSPTEGLSREPSDHQIQYPKGHSPPEGLSRVPSDHQFQYSKGQSPPEGLSKPPTTHQPRPNSALRKTSSSSSILKKTSTSSSLGGGNESSTTTKKVSLDLPPTLCTAHGHRSDTAHRSPDKSPIPFLSTAKLPLLFLDVKNVRVIIPVERYEINCGTDPANQNQKETVAAGPPALSSERKSTDSTSTPSHYRSSSDERVHNCLLLTLTSLSIAPQAENPLTRVELRSDLLSLAKKFAIDHVLGSQIEDRQYACEIGAISVNTGIWSELERSLLSHSSELELNAALLWNSGLTPGAPPHTLPLIREFRVTSTLAPCIVYLYENIVVAGTSLEINAAKDFCLSLTLAQLHLLSHLSHQLVSAFSPLLSQTSSHPTQQPHQRQAPSTWRKHVGNEPARGTAHSLLGKQHAASSKVPFEMLLTGRSIVMELYLTEAHIKPMLCLQLIQPDLLIKVNTVLHQTKESTLNVYDIKLYLNKNFEQTEDSSEAMLSEDPKLEDPAPTTPGDNDSIEGDKARLNQLIRDKQARLLAAQNQARVNQIHLLESLPLPDRKRADNGLIPVLIKISLERSLARSSGESGQRLRCSINKPIRFILHEELIDKFTSLLHKINSALDYPKPGQPTHHRDAKTNNFCEPTNVEVDSREDRNYQTQSEANVEVDSREDRRNYRQSIERVRHKMEAWGLSQLTLNTDQMSFMINHPESVLPGLSVHLASSSVTLSHPLACHLHVSNLSVSTLFTSNISSSHRFLLEPLDLNLVLQCQWETWYPTFLTYLTGDIETFSVNLSSNQIEVLHRLYDQYKRLLPNTLCNQSSTNNDRNRTTCTNHNSFDANKGTFNTDNTNANGVNKKPNASEVKKEPINTFNDSADKTNARPSSNDYKEPINTRLDSSSNQESFNTRNNPMNNLPSSDQDQHYVDDLRAGAFQYIDVSGTPAKLPLSYQILFKHHSITWKYPNPRSITRLYIAPVPEEANGSAEYFLQYYESSTRTFQVYTRFKIVDNSDEILKIDFLDLPPTKPVSDIWRIVHAEYVDMESDTSLYGQSWQTERQHQGRNNGHSQRKDSMGTLGAEERKLSTVVMEGNENNCELSRRQRTIESSQDESSLHEKSKMELKARRKSSENEFELSEARESVNKERETYSCNMKLLLGSIRVDSFYSPKLISNLHINLKNSVFKLNLVYCANNINLKLNKRKLLLQKFTLNESNSNLFKNNDYTIGQLVSNGNELKYSMNPNFNSGLYLTQLTSSSIQWNLINYNLLELKPILEVSGMHVNFYNAEYNAKKTVEEDGMNIDLIVGNHVKVNVSNELVTTANIVKKLVAKTVRQIKDLREKKTNDLKYVKTEEDEGRVCNCDNTRKHINNSKNTCDSGEHTNTVNDVNNSVNTKTAHSDTVKAFDTVEKNIQPTKPEDGNPDSSKLDHEDLNKPLVLPMLNLNELSDPFYHGPQTGLKSTSTGFQSKINNQLDGNSQQNCEDSNCEPCSKWESMLFDYNEEKGETDDTMDEDADGLDVDFMLTTVMICNNTHIPFIVRQYDTKLVSSVYSMECIYFSWPRSYNSPTRPTTVTTVRHHWLEFNIKSVDFQWSSPLPLNLQTRGDHFLTIQGPDERQFPVNVRVDEVDNSLILTIHGNIHCVNLTSSPLSLVLLQGQGRDNQLIQCAGNTVSPSVILNTGGCADNTVGAASGAKESPDVTKYEMKMKLNECVWSGTIPIGANISKSSRAGEDLWLVKLPLKPSSSTSNPSSTPSSSRHSSFISVWLRLLWDYPNPAESSTDLIRMLFVITPLYLIRSTLPNPSLVHVNGDQCTQWISGQGRLEELRIPDCTSQDPHLIRFQLTSHCEPATPPLQVSYRTVEQSSGQSSYTELSVNSALELVYNYSLEVDLDDEYVDSNNNDSVNHLITNIANQLNHRIKSDATPGDRNGNPSTTKVDHQAGCSRYNNNQAGSISESQIQTSMPKDHAENTATRRGFARKRRRKAATQTPNIWESELPDSKTSGGGPTLSRWPFPDRYNRMKPTETVSHIDSKYCTLPLYNHAVCIYFRPWALMFNSLPVRVSLKRDCNGNLDSSLNKLDSTSLLRKRDSSVRHLDSSSLPESSVFCSIDSNSVLAPPRMDSNFWICLELPAGGEMKEQDGELKGRDKELKGHPLKEQDNELKGRSFQSSCSIELRSNQMFYTPKVSGLLYPNSFCYVDTFCDEWMAYTTLISSEYDQSRVLNLCPSYTVANHSSYTLQVQGVAVYPAEERYQIPNKNYSECLTLQPATRTKQIEPLPLLFWKILGPHSPEVRPDLYLIFWYSSTPLCPVLLWSLDAKRAHPLSISPQAGHRGSQQDGSQNRGPQENRGLQDNRGPFGLSLTSHQNERGVQELLVWDNELPQLVFHNRTHVKLSVTPVYEDPKKCPPPIPFEWKWFVNPRSVGYYSLPEQLSPETSTSETVIASVMLELEDPSTGSVSGELLVLSECSGRLVHLASTDFKVTIVKEVISQVITIELASSGEISAMDIRKRLALAFDNEESRSQQSSQTEVNKESISQTRSSITEQYYPRVSQVTLPSQGTLYSTEHHDPSVRQNEMTNSEQNYTEESQWRTNLAQNYSTDLYYPSGNQGAAQSLSSDYGSVGQRSSHLSHVSNQAENDLKAENDVKTKNDLKAEKNLRKSTLSTRRTTNTEDNTCSRRAELNKNARTHREEVHACASEDKGFVLRTLSKYNFHVKSYVHQLNVCFLEDIHQASFTVINIHKILHIVKTSPYRAHYHTPSGSLLNYKLTESSLSVHDIQLDNSAYQYGAYDFNVVLYKSTAHSSGNTVNFVRQRDEFETNVRALLRMRSVDCLRDFLLSAHDQFVEFTVSFHSNHRVYLVDRVNVIIQAPFTLRIEDVFLSRVNDYWRRLLGLKRLKEANCSGDGELLLGGGGGRGSVLAISAGRELAFPLYINSLLIEPFSLSLCLHTSSRFYIALDNSPLSFSRFERSGLVTSSFRLGQSVSLHYFLGAIYATGWAIGRLEFCGTPGGLASSVGTGIRDFLTLPYQALGSGPLGFFLGIYHGSGSLIRHTAAGTLTSVIKAASSWSRTLDRLTLDEDDLQHTEEIRRRRPANLTQGLMQGLSEFGIKIIGAIGGLAYHHIQYALSYLCFVITNSPIMYLRCYRRAGVSPHPVCFVITIPPLCISGAIGGLAYHPIQYALS
uniref:Vacuolar protein sorting-associated protein 13B n=1 Tax=Cacopsylla melanoneura TaxID=428564 RepID=A0A8D8SCP9_9HEMI